MSTDQIMFTKSRILLLAWFYKYILVRALTRASFSKAVKNLLSSSVTLLLFKFAPVCFSPPFCLPLSLSLIWVCLVAAMFSICWPIYALFYTSTQSLQPSSVLRLRPKLHSPQQFHQRCFSLQVGTPKWLARKFAVQIFLFFAFCLDISNDKWFCC